MSSSSCIRSTLAALALLGASAGVAQAQQTPLGFQVSRYEPTAAGEWSFWVDHPWYSSTRRFAGGLTLNYAHNQLTQARQNTNGSVMNTGAIQAHFLSLHLDLAVSFFDRLNITASLPVQLLSQGEGLPAGSLQATGLGFADPRFGLMFRIFGQPDASPISLSVAAHAWIPLNDGANGAFNTRNDTQFRFLPKLILAGYGSRIRWSFTGGFLYRPEARLVANNFVAGTAGSELQLGASIYYADKERRFAIGPEVLLSTVLTGGNAFARDYTSLETLLGAHYNIAHQVQVGAAVGLGILREPGTPDVRFLFRLAYAPIRRPPAPDFDKDGVPDKDDACPQEKGVADPDIRRNGCPLAADQDNDGIADQNDLCPQEPRGMHPDLKRLGCPLGDQDRDGVFDNEDACPKEALGDKPDPARKGCPLPDRDRDGVLDSEDQCPDEASGDKPDAKRRGCPTVQAPRDEAAEEAFLKSLQPIFFAKRSAKLDARNNETLNALADQLRKNPGRKKLLIRGHADKEGKAADSERLALERAEAIKNWLVAQGIAADRLQTKGMGRTLPMLPPEGEPESTSRRLQATRNRRGDFRPVDPVLSDGELKRVEEQERAALSEPAEPTERKTGPKTQKSRLDMLLDQVEREQGPQAEPAPREPNP